MTWLAGCQSKPQKRHCCAFGVLANSWHRGQKFKTISCLFSAKILAAVRSTNASYPFSASSRTSGSVVVKREIAL